MCTSYTTGDFYLFERYFLLTYGSRFRKFTFVSGYTFFSLEIRLILSIYLRSRRSHLPLLKLWWSLSLPIKVFSMFCCLRNWSRKWNSEWSFYDQQTLIWVKSRKNTNSPTVVPPLFLAFSDPARFPVQMSLLQSACISIIRHRIAKNSKWVWSGNTTITNMAPRGRATHQSRDMKTN